MIDMPVSERETRRLPAVREQIFTPYFFPGWTASERHSGRSIAPLKALGNIFVYLSHELAANIMMTMNQ